MTWGDEKGRDLPPNWLAIREAVKARAGGRCQWRLKSGARCPRPGNEADHIGDSDDHSLANLRWLCSAHHAKRTAIQGHQAKAARKKPRRQPEAHPNDW